MLRKFKIKVDGQEYQVEMEEIGAVAPAAPVAPVAAPAGTRCTSSRSSSSTSSSCSINTSWRRRNAVSNAREHLTYFSKRRRHSY